MSREHLSPLQVADAALSELHDLLPRIGGGALGIGYHRIELDTTVDPAPRHLGDTVLACTRSALQGVPVVLDKIADMSVAVEGPDWMLPIEYFTPIYLRPAAAVLAHRIVDALRDEMHKTRGMRHRAFVVATVPMAAPHPEVLTVASRDGLSLRAAHNFDIGLASMVLGLDVLFGLRTLGEEKAL